MERWVYGSVANKALRMVDCPLILVRPPKADEVGPLSTAHGK
jgi:hypothetical protein